MKSLSLARPHLLVVVGIPGAGKTFFAEQFSKTFGAPYIDLAQLQTMLGNDATARTVWEYVLDQLCLTKQTLMLEGSGSTKAERQALIVYAQAKGYQPLFIWVQTDPDTAGFRATKGSGSQGNSSRLTDAQFNAGASRFEQPNPTENYIVISGKHTYPSQAKNVLKRLTTPRAEQPKIRLAERQANMPPMRGRLTIN